MAEIESIIAKDGFWDSPEDSKSILKERTSISNKIDRFKKLWLDLEETQILLDLAVEESDPEVLEEVAQQAESLDEVIDQFSLELMLDGKDDAKNAIVSINAGAGGTEAQDWAEMLFRMYTRWVERKNYKLRILDFQPGDEAGIKSATILVKGLNAYGWLKTESGVHRLVRISPFDSNARRHTSFASVWIYPVIDENIDIEIDEHMLILEHVRAEQLPELGLRQHRRVDNHLLRVRRSDIEQV